MATSILSRTEALLDTNLLTSYIDVDNPSHGRVVRFMHRSDLRLHVAPQSLYEFWAVATRPKKVNGLERSHGEVWESVVAFRRVFTIQSDPPEILDEWLDLCRTHNVSGKNAHDARLAAYARLQGIGTLVTLNARDFARYGLTVVVP